MEIAQYIPTCQNCNQRYEARRSDVFFLCVSSHTFCENCVVYNSEDSSPLCPVCGGSSDTMTVSNSPTDKILVNLMSEVQKNRDNESGMSICSECQIKTTDSMMRICQTCVDKEDHVETDNIKPTSHKIDEMAVCLACINKRHTPKSSHKTVSFIELKVKRESAKVTTIRKEMTAIPKRLCSNLHKACQELDSVIESYERMSMNADSCGTVNSIVRKLGAFTRSIDNANKLLERNLTEYRKGIESCTSSLKLDRNGFLKACRREENDSETFQEKLESVFYGAIGLFNGFVGFVLCLIWSIVRYFIPARN